MSKRPRTACEPGPNWRRAHAVRAHLLETAGERVAARAAYELAAGRTTSLPQQRYLNARAARLAE